MAPAKVVRLNAVVVGSRGKGGVRNVSITWTKPSVKSWS